MGLFIHKTIFDLIIESAEFMDFYKMNCSDQATWTAQYNPGTRNQKNNKSN